MIRDILLLHDGVEVNYGGKAKFCYFVNLDGVIFLGDRQML